MTLLRNATTSSFMSTASKRAGGYDIEMELHVSVSSATASGTGEVEHAVSRVLRVVMDSCRITCQRC